MDHFKDAAPSTQSPKAQLVRPIMTAIHVIQMGFLGMFYSPGRPVRFKEVDGLLLRRPPQSLNEVVVDTAAPTVQAGDIVLADRAYDSDGLRAVLSSCRAWGCIKPLTILVNIPSLSCRVYRQPNAV